MIITGNTAVPDRLKE